MIKGTRMEQLMGDRDTPAHARDAVEYVSTRRTGQPMAGWDNPSHVQAAIEMMSSTAWPEVLFQDVRSKIEVDLAAARNEGPPDSERVKFLTRITEILSAAKAARLKTL